MLPEVNGGGIALGCRRFFNSESRVLNFRHGDKEKQMPNNYLFDNHLTLKAKGLLSVLLENTNIDSKQKIINYTCDGRDSINSTIKELETKGYLQIKRKTEKGQIYIFEAYPCPKFLN